MIVAAAATAVGATVIATSRAAVTAVVRARANDGAAASTPRRAVVVAVLAATLAAVLARANDGTAAVVTAAAAVVDGDITAAAGVSITMDTSPMMMTINQSIVPLCDGLVGSVQQLPVSCACAGGLGAAGRRGPPLAGAPCLAAAAPDDGGR